MPLAAGTRIGPYEIHAALGAGGMGEVYKARDSRLDRMVALKILPTDLAADAERRARFEREARIIAGLSDPHICVVHDVGRDGDVNYLVMEYLEGETLAETLSRRSEPLPVDQVLRYAGDIAHALAKAHKAGIVHRDLKPGNIMLTKTGAKLLDFGLAKPKSPVGGLGTSFAETRAAAPTTVAGTVLGTVPYMAPEQVEGREADARSDIWSLGVVIYEMATGTRPFQGASAASVIGAILKDTPRSMRSLQTLTPPALEHLVERCLDKDPEERWQHAGDIERELAWIARAPGSSPAQQAADRPVTRSRLRPLVAGVGLTAALGAGLVIGTTTARRNTSSEEAAKQDVLRFQVLPPPDTTWSPSPIASTAQLAISPDGSRLAFVAAKQSDSSRIWIRPLDRLDARPVPGTEGASFPFWSPDGRFLAFFAAGKLKKVDVELGTPQVLCDVAAGRGGAWSPTGVIVFGNTTSPLSRVSADGGPVTPATSFDQAQDPAWHYWPHFLPDGRHFLYLQRSVKPEYQGIFVGSLNSPETTRLIGTDVRGLFASGRLLFVRDGLLFAQPLDLETLRLTGEPARLAEGIGYYAAAFGYAAVDVSTHGVIAFGPTLRTSRSLQSFDRDGRPFGPSVEGPYTAPRLSNDQRLVAVEARDQGANDSDIWVVDMARGLPSRVTSDPQAEQLPAWMPDSKRVLFASTRSPSSGGANSIYRRDVSGGTDETLSSVRLLGFPDDLSLDGKLLLARLLTKRGYDIRVVSLEPDGKTVDYLSSPFNEVQARFSPDWQWVAYASDESGRFEVYVRSYPSASDRIPISVNGGTQPEWRRDGKELFYLSADRKIVAVPITSNGNGNGLVPGTPRALFSIDVTEPVAPYRSDYTVTGDGQRFVVSSLAKATTPQTLTVLYNWTSYLGK